MQHTNEYFRQQQQLNKTDNYCIMPRRTASKVSEMTENQRTETTPTDTLTRWNTHWLLAMKHWLAMDKYTIKQTNNKIVEHQPINASGISRHTVKLAVKQVTWQIASIENLASYDDDTQAPVVSAAAL